jgi:hypothetical protein
MWKNVLLILAVFALIASAGTVPVGHYRITLSQPATVQGTVLKAGDYLLTLKETKLTFIGENGKVPVEVTVKLETGEKKFDVTSVRLQTASGSAVVSEIRLGGTKTTLVLN